MNGERRTKTSRDEESAQGLGSWRAELGRRASGKDFLETYAKGVGYHVCSCSQGRMPVSSPRGIVTEEGLRPKRRRCVRERSGQQRWF
ncbi:MAG: hypothetical protein Cons2KO_21500 [Congregibacter sp.]